MANVQVQEQARWSEPDARELQVYGKNIYYLCYFFNCKHLQTVWTQIRPNRKSVVISIQNV